MSKIHSELRIVWIAPDGSKFLNKKDAEEYCIQFNLIDNKGEINEKS